MKKKLKIIIALFVSFTISSISANTVFLAGTPYINRPFLAQLRDSPGRMIAYTRDYLGSLRGGRSGVTEYQQSRIMQYTADQSSDSNFARGGAPDTLPAPERPEDFEAQGYTAIGNDSYTRQNVAANTLEIYFGEDAKFEKRTMEMDGQTVDAWVPL